MNIKHSRRYNKNKTSNTLKILIFLAFSYFAIQIGAIAGNILYETNFKFVENIDVQMFKTSLNNSLPLIDSIYNSGKISVSFSNEINRVIKSIFTFDLREPITILNAQSPMLYSYYVGDYAKKLAQQDEINPNPRTQSPQPGATPKPGSLPTPASSITWEGDGNEPGKKVTKDDIVIDNQTKLKINIDELLKEPLKIKFKKSGPKLLIYHTHTTESYIRDNSSTSRTTNPEENVVRVGEELARYLEKDGIDVVHNGTINDYDYNSSYSKSLQTASVALKGYPSIKVAFDVHRDALDDSKKLKTATKIKGQSVAKVMFVVGTNQRGLDHPNWKENLKLAIKLQSKLNKLYPGLAKPIILSKNRYNQHLTLGSLIIEIGGDGDKLDEAVRSARYVAEAVNEVLGDIK
jgi:stage II sporulation protein P